MSDREQLNQYIKQHKSDHLARIREFMAQPSVSQENNGVEECAALLLRYFQELGCAEAELVETPVLPGGVVLATKREKVVFCAQRQTTDFACLFRRHVRTNP